jgi:putative ABC transport system permease protein
VPDWKTAIRERLTGAALDPTFEADVVEELAQHLDDRFEHLQTQGLPLDECQRRALSELDDRVTLVTGVRLARRPRVSQPSIGGAGIVEGFLSGLWHDVHFAWTQIRMRPSFAAIAGGMLAVGVAGNAAAFSLFNGLFLRPLPFVHSDRLVDLDETAPRWHLQYAGISGPDFDRWRSDNTTFERMAFFRTPSYNLSDRTVARRVRGALVTRDMLEVLGLAPAIGRTFTPEEDAPGAPHVVLLSDGLWRQTFQGDRQVLGHVLQLDAQPYTVVGVLPPEAVFPDRVDVWIPLAEDTTISHGNYLSGVGRLKSGVTVEQAQADLRRIHKAMIADGHRVNDITSPLVTPLRDRYVGHFQASSRVLMAAVAIVLLIACVNIATLLLVRSTARARELAIRTALGASSRRIVGQLAVEMVVLAAAGATVGVLLGAASLRVLTAWVPDDVPKWIVFSLDGRFAAFCVAITGGAALAFGLAPALESSRVDLRGALQDVCARATSARARHTVSVLVIGEVALAFILAAGAGLLIEAFNKVQHVDPGFRPENVLMFRISPPSATYDTPGRKIRYYETLLMRLRALPGVRAAGATSSPPFGGQWGGVFEAEGARAAGANDDQPVVLRVAATPGYVEALGMTLLAGRSFEERDDQPEAPQVALVNEAFARYYWGNSNAIGKRIRQPGGRTWLQIVGLLHDDKHYGLDQEAKPSVFHPYGPTALTVDANDARSLQSMSIVLRSAVDPTTLVVPVRDVVNQLDRDVPLYALDTMTTQIDRSMWVRRAISWLIAAFAAIALGLAAFGVYGVLSYAVSQRSREIAIRVALGARPMQVLTQMLLHGMGLVSIGVAAGLIAAFWVLRLMRPLLFAVSPDDPRVFILVVLGIMTVGMLASGVPAGRASAIDPQRTLHLD